MAIWYITYATDKYQSFISMFISHLRHKHQHITPMSADSFCHPSAYISPSISVAKYVVGYFPLYLLCITVECLYDAVHYEKSLHTSLKWRGQNIYQRIYKRHTISGPNGRAIICLLWGFGENWPRYNGITLNLVTEPERNSGLHGKSHVV